MINVHSNLLSCVQGFYELSDIFS